MYLLGRVILWRTVNVEPENSSNTEKCSFPLPMIEGIDEGTYFVNNEGRCTSLHQQDYSRENNSREVASAQHWALQCISSRQHLN